MARIGGMELLVVLIVALFAIGPERLPKAARVLGRALGMFKKTMNDAMRDLGDVSDEFKVVGETISDAQREVRKAITQTDEEVKKTAKHADEALGNGPKKKKKAKDAAAEEQTAQPSAEAVAEASRADDAPAQESETDAQQSA